MRYFSKRKLPPFILAEEHEMIKKYKAVVLIVHHLEKDAQAFLTVVEPAIATLLENELQHDGLKFLLTLTADMEKPIVNTEDVEPNTAYFKHKTVPILNHGEIAPKLQEVKHIIMVSLEKFTNIGSGWRLYRCVFLNLNIYGYQPFREQSYFETPKKIRNKKAIVNVQN